MEFKLPFVDWREGLRNGDLLGLKCNDCGAITCPPRKVCSECCSEDLDIIKIKKNGRINTFTVCHVVPAGFTGPYVVAMADLDAGLRLMGRVIDVDPIKVGMEIIGKEVELGFEEIPGDFMTGQDTRIYLTFKLVD